MVLMKHSMTKYLAPVLLLIAALHVPSAAKAEDLEAMKAKKWEEIPNRFYRWKFGEKGHLRKDQIVHLAENIMAAQCKDGGWQKNRDLSTLKVPKRGHGSTLDNLTTYTQISYLARVRKQTGLARYDEAIIKGVDYVLKSQVGKSGGWRGADVNAVTFNDDVMTGVMNFVREVTQSDELYGWLDDERRTRAAKSFEKGLQCILKCQVRQGDTLTAWGQQHDHGSLKPCWARNYEPPCITASESIGVIRFLMSIENPSKEVVQSIESAVKWLEKVKLNQVKVKIPDPNYGKRKFDILILDDLKDPRVAANESWGPPIWARMYHPETNEVLLYERGKKKLGKFSEMGQERRTGYAWHGTWPKKLLEEDYPKWKRR